MSHKPKLWKWILFLLVIAIAGALWKLQQVSDWAREAMKSADEPELIPPPQPTRAIVHQEDQPQAPSPQPDDLKQIKGIGPKVMQLLNEHNIHTFEQLAATEVSRLKSLLEKRNWRMANPSTWPKQAQALAVKKNDTM